MAGVFEVLLFGDETGDSREFLQKLCQHQRGVVFQHFILKVDGVLRDEVRRQPRAVKQRIPPFTDLLDLLKRYQDSAFRNPILETTLACICIKIDRRRSFFDDHPSQYLVPSNTLLVGLCTGLLPAAAVSASQSLLDLISNALDIVRVAFRLSVKVNGAAQRLSAADDVERSQSWSRLVVGAQKEAAATEVRQFNERKGLPKANEAYLSSHSKDVVTVSGPPDVVQALLLESEYFRRRKTVPLDIFGPFHAAHLYNDNDVEEVVQVITETDRKVASPSLRVISGTTETPLSDVSLHEFLKEVVSDILIRPLSFDGVLAAVASEARNSGRKTCKLSPVGPSNAPSSLVSALGAGSGTEVSVGEQLGMPRLIAEPQGTTIKIAIVGMAGRFPNADSLESLWSTVEHGLDVHRRIPPDRFDVEAHYDPTGKRKNTSHTPYGCFIEEPGLFDPHFFNMSPREAYQTDPMGRLALVTAYEALEMSGFVPNRTPSSMLDRVGTFYGQTSDDWRQLNAAQTIDTYYIPGTIRAFASGRINYHFKFKGPSYNVDTACSSSFAAIQLACTSLQAKECDTAVAGGLNIMTTPDLFAGLSRAQFLSKTGSCKTFDDTADGFCRGDGVGTVILKRLEDAEADKDPILGVILGTATNHSSEAVSMTQPHGPTQEALYRKILRNTGVQPCDVSYVEMHGTGTQVGDGTEMKSISEVFAPRGHQGRQPGQKLHLGAIKANIGHGEASAGVASLIKVLLMLQRNAIPPHVGIKGTMNKTFPSDLEERGIRIAFKETTWSAPDGQKRRAYLNNFGASGGNTGLLLEDASKASLMTKDDPRSTFVVSITAKSGWSLRSNIQNLIDFLEMKPDVSLPSLSYTTTARRAQHPYRVSFAVSSISEAKESMMSAQADLVKPISTIPPKVLFVFTGQGAHYPMLGKQLFGESEQFRSDLMEFDRISCNQGFPSFLPLVDGTDTGVNPFSSIVLQLGQTCIQMALARLWISWGISPRAVLGHSLGEYAALHVAGVLSASDTIFLVGRRAEILQKVCIAGSHAMLAVATSVTSTRQVLAGENLEVACINGPRETVISGPAELMISYSKTLKTAGIKCVLLRTPYAFHSAQVESILDPLKEIASSVTFRNPAIPVISPLLREIVTDRHVFGPDYLARHARETVDFLGAVINAKEEGLVDQDAIWVEIGPAPVCSAFLRSSLGSRTVAVPSLREREDAWKTTANGLSLLHSKGLRIDWNEVHREYDSSHTVLALPSYTFENKNYWLEYTNNWCLNKGEVIEAASKTARERSLPTSSVQKLIKEDYGNKITLVAESDLSEPDLNNAVSGHLVNGSALCPSVRA
ncbi:MAG: Type I Iterative PKS [Bathelium mastoideum]|nr:MAG: Type I Iterative PKS [Bathelium mastoideum]